jgi:predicted DNA-binding WGR domain protein
MGSATLPADSSETLTRSMVMTHHYAKLQKRDPKRNQYRYYLLDVQPNLFGTWSLIREWGRIGRPGQVRIDLCDSLDEAAHAFEGKRLQKQRRGYADSVTIGDVNPSI